MSAQRRAVEQRDAALPEGLEDGASFVEVPSRGEAAREPQGDLSRMFTLAESPKAFWDEMIATLGEFSTVVRASRDRVAQLSLELAKRDNSIALLKAKNVALEARLGIADAAPTIPQAMRPLQPAPPVSQSPTDPAKDGGIWRRLTRLERE